MSKYMCEFVKELGNNIPVLDVEPCVPDIPEPVVDVVPTTVSTHTQTGGYPKPALVQKKVSFQLPIETVVPSFKFSLNTIYFLFALAGIGVMAYVSNKKSKEEDDE